MNGQVPWICYENSDKCSYSDDPHRAKSFVLLTRLRLDHTRVVPVVDDDLALRINHDVAEADITMQNPRLLRSLECYTSESVYIGKERECQTYL